MRAGRCALVSILVGHSLYNGFVLLVTAEVVDDLETDEVLLLQSSVESYRYVSEKSDGACQEGDAIKLDRKVDEEASKGRLEKEDEEAFPSLGYVLRLILRVGIFVPLFQKLRSSGTLGKARIGKAAVAKESEDVVEASRTPSQRAAPSEKAQGKDNPCAVLEAVQKNDVSRCKALLKSGSTANACDGWGCSALHIAAGQGSGAMTELLLANGADIEATDAVDETPLHYAARNGNLEVVRLLLAAGVDMNATDMQSRTPLFIAGLENHEETCEFLWEAGAHLGGAKDSDLPELITALMLKGMTTPDA